MINKWLLRNFGFTIYLLYFGFVIAILADIGFRSLERNSITYDYIIVLLSTLSLFCCGIFMLNLPQRLNNALMIYQFKRSIQNEIIEHYNPFDVRRTKCFFLVSSLIFVLGIFAMIKPEIALLRVGLLNDMLGISLFSLLFSLVISTLMMSSVNYCYDRQQGKVIKLKQQDTEKGS